MAETKTERTVGRKRYCQDESWQNAVDIAKKH